MAPSTQKGLRCVSQTRSLATASTSNASRARLRFGPSDDRNLQHFLRKAEERNQRQAVARQKRLEESTKSIPAFSAKLKEHDHGRLRRDTPTILQINIGKLCNLNCRHCHVESGPTKTHENMDLRTVERCLELLRTSPTIDTVDITGGAPELNPHFRTFVAKARAMGKKVIDRCNFAVLFEKGQEDLADFLAEQEVDLVASLPCYTEDNTDKQRGKRVFDDSITALRILNTAGFGRHQDQPDRRLDLVYNPLGPSLPPPQQNLEADYRQRLAEEHQVTFNSLLAITNMPIKRFADDLYQTGQYKSYMETLVNAFNPGTVKGLMCRNTVNVAWDGRIYDCDFNAALEMQSRREEGGDGVVDIWSLDDVADLYGGAIRTGKHCYGCTAGSGSSCGGTLA